MKKIRTLFRHAVRYYRRKKILEGRGWYRNMAGGFTEPHAMCALSKSQLFFMSAEDFIGYIR